MREIKFRGKIVNNFDIKTFNEENKTKYKIDDWIYGFVIKGLNNRYWIWFELNNKLVCIEIDPKTKGQYTGLKDKNGKEIYEGDVVKHKNGFIYIICFNTINLCFYLKQIKNDIYTGGISGQDMRLHVSEIMEKEHINELSK